MSKARTRTGFLNQSNERMFATFLCSRSGFRRIRSRGRATLESSIDCSDVTRSPGAVRARARPRALRGKHRKSWQSSRLKPPCVNRFAFRLTAVDLYLVHAPGAPRTRDETWAAMESILESGKARAVGVSNFGVKHLEHLLRTCKYRPAVNQVRRPPVSADG